MALITFITGASSGIGKATAYKLASEGHNLIISGRRKERLDEIATDLKTKFNIEVHPLCFDLSDRKACEMIFKDHKALFAQMNVLVNNAGLARGVDPMDQAQIDDWEEMVDTNIKGLLYITRLSLPFLKKNTPAHILNIGSVAGRWTYPGGGIYCATKFAVRAITEGLRMDLLGTDIRVTNISPGLVETEFSDVRLRDSKKAKDVYKGLKALSGEDIADCVSWSLNRPQHVNIQELVVFPTEQASVRDVSRS